MYVYIYNNSRNRIFSLGSRRNAVAPRVERTIRYLFIINSAVDHRRHPSLTPIPQYVYFGGVGKKGFMHKVVLFSCFFFFFGKLYVFGGAEQRLLLLLLLSLLLFFVFIIIFFFLSVHGNYTLSARNQTYARTTARHGRPRKQS